MEAAQNGHIRMDIANAGMGIKTEGETVKSEICRLVHATAKHRKDDFTRKVTEKKEKYKKKLAQFDIHNMPFDVDLECIQTEIASIRAKFDKERAKWTQRCKDEISKMEKTYREELMKIRKWVEEMPESLGRVPFSAVTSTSARHLVRQEPDDSDEDSDEDYLPLSVRKINFNRLRFLAMHAPAEIGRPPNRMEASSAQSFTSRIHRNGSPTHACKRRRHSKRQANRKPDFVCSGSECNKKTSLYIHQSDVSILSRKPVLVCLDCILKRGVTFKQDWKHISSVQYKIWGMTQEEGEEALA